MADASDQPTNRQRLALSRATSNTFKALFALAAVIAAGATYLAVTNDSPQAAGATGLLWLLIGNLVLVAGVAGVLGLRVVQLLLENRETNGGARLRLRIIFLFSLAAAVPTVIVAGFLAVAINRSVEHWFSQPIQAIVESAKAAGQATQKELTDSADEDLQAVSMDLQTCDATCRATPGALQNAAKTLAEYRNFPEITVLGAGGSVLASMPTENPALPTSGLRGGLEGKLRSLSIDANSVRGIARLPAFGDAYVYVMRPVPVAIGERLAQTSQHLAQIRAADAHRNQLSLVLTLSYIEAALLMLLGTAWLGMTAAARIAMPIGQLAGAARAVRDGDLSVRMERPEVRDEIDDLADAFNQMTERLSRQTKALDNARIEAERRTGFIETVLSGVEAGVIRVDPELKITIANASAQALLDFTQPTGKPLSLSDVAPEFVAAARRALETGQLVEASFRRATESGAMHLQVRVAPEADEAREPGAIITFHDTTRLVLGQRQAAWRDVARRIAHEIRNPLTPIQLSAERLRRRFASQITTDRETFERCTDTITRQVADMGRMVEEFSGFARMPKPTFGEFNIVEMVQQVAFAQRMSTPAIAVVVNPPDHPVQMRGDERLLAQALTNIVKNAAEAVERSLEAGEMKAGNVTIDIYEDGEEVQLTIRDNGPGFPVQDRDRLLEPYVTTRKSGVGLGLAIVTRIVEDHGGRIWLGDNDHAASGARVDVRMPVQPNLSDELVAYAGEGAA